MRTPRPGRAARAVAAWLAWVWPLATAAQAASYPPPAEGDFLINNFHFTSGETLPQLRIHYRPLILIAAHTRGTHRMEYGRADIAGGFYQAGFIVTAHLSPRQKFNRRILLQGGLRNDLARDAD